MHSWISCASFLLGTYHGIEVAIKSCRGEISEEQKKKFLQEGKLLRNYDHPNIVKLIGIGIMYS